MKSEKFSVVVHRTTTLNFSAFPLPRFRGRVSQRSCGGGGIYTTLTENEIRGVSCFRNYLLPPLMEDDGGTSFA